jgi:preprotein translocase subunit SecA
MLTMKKIPHQVLNAKLHQKEAEIVAEAGKSGTVTIATNMAGRGTDIKLTPESKAAGGLAIIGTERHESRRVDRQLRGRAGRQGDPGTSQFFVSLEDQLMRLFGSDRISRVMDRFGFKEGEVIQHSMITRSIERAQRKVEENNFGQRKRLLEYDNVMNVQRENIYRRRRNALSGERLQIDIMNMLLNTSEDIINNYQGPGNYENARLEVLKIFGIDAPFTQEEFEKGDPNKLSIQLYDAVNQHYIDKNQQILQNALPVLSGVLQEKGAVIEEIIVPFSDGRKQLNVIANLKKTIETQGRELIEEMEKAITLSIIDQEWKEHLRDMDDLKQSVQGAVWEQKDPLVIYKFEGFNLFEQLVARINKTTVSFLMRGNLPIDNTDQVKEARRSKKVKEKLQENKAQLNSSLSSSIPKNTDFPQQEAQKVMPIKSHKTVGRNDKVSVRYNDGKVLKDVKFKNIEDDLQKGKCVLIEN